MTGADVNQEPLVTIVVSPRDRFSVAQDALLSIFEHTTAPYRLVYVDGAAPRALREWIAAQAEARGFELISSERFLTPNEARNIGLRRARTPYVVFIENDVICSPGWLEPLLACAQETGVEVVAPLTCQHLPLHTQVHQAGGLFTSDVAAFFATPQGERIIDEAIHHQGDTVDAVPAGRAETQCCEFHCVLVRRDVFERTGEFDEQMVNTKDHLDFSMSVIATGGKVLLEPRSVVTFLLPNRVRPLVAQDWPFFLVRWSPRRQRRSFERFQTKWGLKADQAYLTRRDRKLYWRYEEGIVKPILKRLPLVQRVPILAKAVGALVRRGVYAAGAVLTFQADHRRVRFKA